MHTGEVITAEHAVDQGLIVGDAVNAAARLQSSAPTGAVLIGPETRRLVASAMRLRRHGDLELRGKTGRMRTWLRRRACGPRRESLRATADAGMVGRRRELRRTAPPLRPLPRARNGASSRRCSGRPGSASRGS